MCESCFVSCWPFGNTSGLFRVMELGGGKELCGKAGRCISGKHIWFLEGYFCVICQDRTEAEESLLRWGGWQHTGVFAMDVFAHNLWIMCAYIAKMLSGVCLQQFRHRIHTTQEFLRKSEKWGSKEILENVTPARREKNLWESSADQHWWNKGNPVKYIPQNLTFGYPGIWSGVISLELALIVHQLVEFWTYVVSEDLVSCMFWQFTDLQDFRCYLFILIYVFSSQIHPS